MGLIHISCGLYRTLRLAPYVYREYDTPKKDNE